MQYRLEKQTNIGISNHLAKMGAIKYITMEEHGYFRRVAVNPLSSVDGIGFVSKLPRVVSGRQVGDRLAPREVANNATRGFFFGL